MPTYQYSCTECGHFLEAVQSFSDDSLTVCPECEGRLRKVFNAVGVVFKGSGFYRNDSRAGAANGGSSESGSSTDGADGSSGSGKEKPAVKPAAAAGGKGPDQSAGKRESGSSSTATPKSA